MKLYVMRHGPADDDSPSGRDADRALTAAGRERVAAVAKALLEEGEAPFSILSSPLVRALADRRDRRRGHASLPARPRGRRRPTEQGRRVRSRFAASSAWGRRSSALLAELVRAGRKRVMIVGHEPDLSMLVMSLVGKELESGHAVRRWSSG